eukprot:CAMPEP_0175063072 /NCGR_PEP_ID=MMETSP0052_2-20121109/14537_1 /TAXON_ID=51329 ORGANISM="Polytomella parva, Strain SAG 63-3" /NCGR_SAMPLE_ID=MMETSP0052_2 /ASSEMBLY_ACC=CAM_ASM_000194 /LENGTH=292 /DNA_ID=CAMNT_0016329197 /DNA_START=234 /DNA_END=1112 /DNA_ORIENTATION=+
MQNEATNLAEWIEYHSILGVDHFFLADDCSFDKTVELTQNVFVKEGKVTLYQLSPCTETHRPDESRLIRHLYNQAKDICEYSSYINMDDFVTVQTNLYNGTLAEYLHEKSPIYLKLFSQSMNQAHVLLRKKKLVIERFHQGEVALNLHKSVIKSKIATDWTSPHFPNSFTEPEGVQVKTIVQDLKVHENELYDVTIPSSESKTRFFIYPFFLNHYVLKSLTEYLCGRGNRIYTAGGSSNTWGINPLGLFEDWSRTRRKPAVAQDFTNLMATKVHHNLKQLTEKYPVYWQFLQ